MTLGKNTCTPISINQGALLVYSLFKGGCGVVKIMVQVAVEIKSRIRLRLEEEESDSLIYTGGSCFKDLCQGRTYGYFTLQLID